MWSCSFRAASTSPKCHLGGRGRVRSAQQNAYFAHPQFFNFFNQHKHARFGFCCCGGFSCWLVSAMSPNGFESIVSVCPPEPTLPGSPIRGKGPPVGNNNPRVGRAWAALGRIIVRLLLWSRLWWRCFSRYVLGEGAYREMFS